MLYYFHNYLNLEIFWHTALSDAQYLKLNLLLWAEICSSTEFDITIPRLKGQRSKSQSHETSHKVHRNAAGREPEYGFSDRGGTSCFTQNIHLYSPKW